MILKTAWKSSLVLWYNLTILKQLGFVFLIFEEH